MSAHLNTEAVRSFPCFSDLTEAEAVAAMEAFRTVELAAGDRLFAQGDAGDSVYLIAAGQVDVLVDIDGKADDHVVSTLERGAIFGEMSLLLQEPRSATAVAHTAATLWEISAAAYQAAVDAEQPWVYKFMCATAHALARRLSTLDRKLSDLISAEAQPEAPVAGAARVAELESLRTRLFSEWSF